MRCWALWLWDVYKRQGAMREHLAAVMGVDSSRVSVKATTTERLGFVGRGEGCEVWAVVMLCKD